MAKWKDIKPEETGAWLKLKQGVNKIRIVSEAEPIRKHWTNKKSSVCIGKDTCPLCAEGNQAKTQWMLWVIDRTDNGIKLLNIGYMIVEQISKLAVTEEYAFDTIPTYDITINKTGEGLETTYTVIPARTDTPLTEEEKADIKLLKPIADIKESIKAKAMPQEEQSGLEPF